jgi:hypothetical protein
MQEIESIIEQLKRRRAHLKAEYDRVNRAIEGLESNPEPLDDVQGLDLPSVNIRPTTFLNMRPNLALEQLLAMAGKPLTFSEALALLERGGLKTTYRVLSVAVPTAGKGARGKTFYVEGDKIGLVAWLDHGKTEVDPGPEQAPEG